MLSPVLKWAGGKRKLLPSMIERIPDNFSGYVEPFVGGGAMFFELRSRNLIAGAVLSDVNSDLISLYTIIRDKPEQLIESLVNIDYRNNREDFNRAREEFNSDPLPVRKAALMIYLNRHCFNGLYRVNFSGKFNVPFGRYNNPVIPGKEQIMEVSGSLKNVDLKCCDFENSIREAGERDFVYLDPPYQPISETSSFTSYSSGGFEEEGQRRLAKVFRDASSSGVFLMISNSDSPLIRELYSDFKISNILAARNINSNGKGRGKINEVLITNY